MIRLHSLARPALALVATVIVGVATVAILRPLSLIVLGATRAEYLVVAIAIVGNLLAVPLIAGFTLGFIARRQLFVLSVLYVIISLFGTFLSLGAAGLPHGMKVLTYGLQLALLYGAAVWGARASKPRAVSS